MDPEAADDIPEDGVPEDGVPEDGVPEDGVPEDGGVLPEVEDGVPEEDALSQDQWDQALRTRRDLIGGNTPNSASSSVSSSPFLSSWFRREKGANDDDEGDEEETRVTVVTAEDESTNQSRDAEDTRDRTTNQNAECDRRIKTSRTEESANQEAGSEKVEVSDEHEELTDRDLNNSRERTDASKTESESESERTLTDERERPNQSAGKDEEGGDSSEEEEEEVMSQQSQMKRKLDHGPDGRPFPTGKKHCKGNGFLSPSSLAPATPTTFGELRVANGHSAQRRRVTSGPPPAGLAEWLRAFQTWSGPERLLALDELIDRCETTQVKHMMQLIEPQFQRDFISLLPKEVPDHNTFIYLFIYLFTKLSHTFKIFQKLLWNPSLRSEWFTLWLWSSGISEQVSSSRRRSACVSPWKSAYIRQHRIESNWRSGDEREPMVLKGHDDHVITCLQFSGDLIVSGSDDNTLKVWSAVTGKVLRTLSGHTGGVWCSQMSVATVISGSTDRTLRVWDAERGDCVHILYGHTSTVRCMHLHGNRVVSGSRDTTLRVWDVASGRCEHVLTGHVAAVRCVQFDGRRVVSGGYDYMVKVWDPESEVCLHTLQGHTNRVYSLQFDGAFVVSGSLDTSIRVWEADTGNCVHTLTGHQSLTSGMELRDNMLVSGNADSTVRVWDVRTGQCLHTLQGPHKHLSAVTCLQFCRGLVLSSSDDGTVKLWDLNSGAWIRDVVTLQSRGSGGVVWRIRASDTRLVCAAGSRNGTEETKLLVLDFDLGETAKDEE
ncbi:F-box/WD repeat-containing protein 7-like [Boleophthalmus pectinirostris]|uniref:F-box/WD repeat-containing protein 7-like n=1 Tax=Boleophthalmus pectinirostris TaxID=150288 RepID=UPI00242AC24A|nr:F-box/WD repeat-containing protein 7-like [Boleophthalmus pectinirostris]